MSGVNVGGCCASQGVPVDDDAVDSNDVLAELLPEEDVFVEVLMEEGVSGPG